MTSLSMIGLGFSMTMGGLVGYACYLCGHDAGRKACRLRIHNMLQEYPLDESSSLQQQAAVQYVSLWVRRELRKDEGT